VSPYLELVELAERELAAARDGRWEEMAALGDARVRCAAGLTGPAPPAARPELERLAAAQDALVALVTAARAVTARELAMLRRGSGAARGYAASLVTAPAATRVDYAS
jgi:hypothetical protein